MPRRRMGASGGRLLTLRSELKAQVPLLPAPYQAQGSWSLSPVPNSTHLPIDGSNKPASQAHSRTGSKEHQCHSLTH